MKNLFVEYIKTNNEHRQSEFDFCIKHNILSGFFDNIYVITNHDLPVFSSKITKIFK